MDEWHGTKYWQRRSKEERTRRAAIPTTLEHARMSNYDTSVGGAEAHATVHDWLEEYPSHRASPQGLLLVGRSGSGKSHLAVAALRAAIRTYRQCGYYITAFDYLRVLDDYREFGGVLPDSYAEGNLVTYLKHVYDVVVLDGLDQTRNTDFARQAITELAVSRYDRGLVTIYTTSTSELSYAINKRFEDLVNGTNIGINVRAGNYWERPRGR